ncbi:MAG: glycine betaine ABC transporter substrate-binding protein [Peptococcaceae bacterium]|nr:glycine betaine ABC transporter substrate-binding protein [Candidatus Syntrophopropionicum ammoniitolerans]
MVIILSSVLVITGCGTDSDPVGGTDGKIKVSIGKVPYPDMWPAAYIMRDVAAELGHETEIVEADMGLMYQGLAQGSITVFPDVCLPFLHQSYVDKYEGQFEVVGKVYEDAPSGFTVPTYVDIDTIDELKGRAGDFGGRVVGIEPSAGIMIQAIEAMEAYGLDGYELLEGSTPAMLADVKNATSNENPILFLSWRPHPMWVDYDLKILEDSKGIWHPYDCRTGVNNNLKEDAPELYNFIQGFGISLEDIEKMLVKMEVDGMDPEALAKDWIEQNRALVDELIGK